MAKYHPNKDINAAIEDAVNKGWRFEKSGPRAHAYGILYCAAGNRSGCHLSVSGTPRVPEHEAQKIRKRVERCRCTEE